MDSLALTLGRTTPWDSQVEDFEHLKDQPHVLVGNDMGTGKTYLAGLLDAYRRMHEEGTKFKTLCVTPLNTFGSVEDDEGWLGMWAREFPHLKVVCIDPKNRSAFLKQEADVYIMHPQALRLMPELMSFGFDHVIADECQMFKTRSTKQTKALKKIKVPYRTAMSGTPATDHPHDLWSILNWLKPNEYTSFWRFYKQAVEYEIIYPQQFHKIIGPSRWWTTVGLDSIRPWYVRRTKEQMDLGIPDKIYQTFHVTLDGAHRRGYDQMAQDMIAWVGENEDKPIVAPAVIAKLIRLQQMAIAYLDFDFENHTVKMCHPAPKVDLACEIILQNEDDHFVVFSQFKAPLAMVKQQLEAKGVGVVSYTGDDTRSARNEGKAMFINDPKTRVMVSTIKAGGVGVDGLQKVCNNAIFLDRDWSPSINFQAEDRLHRGGQVKHPLIIDIMARNTVDAGRKQKIELKWSWIRAMLGDT